MQRAWIMNERFRMLLNFAQFRSAHAGKCLAGRSAHDDVEGVCNVAEIMQTAQISRCGLCDVNRLAVGLSATMKIQTM